LKGILAPACSYSGNLYTVSPDNSLGWKSVDFCGMNEKRYEDYITATMMYNRSMNRLFLGILFVACSVVLTFGQAVQPRVSLRAITQIVEVPVLKLKGKVQITTDRLAITQMKPILT
jgi:hypothetical protein